MKTLTELLDINASFEDILNNLREQTKDFTDESGEVAFDDQYEAELAMSILKSYYNNVDNSGLDVVDEDSVFTIKYSSPNTEELSEAFKLADQRDGFSLVTEGLKAIQKGSTIIQTPQFVKEFKKLKLNDDDMRDLELSLTTYPPEASLGSNLYKFRWSPKKWGAGQSNGARVIYVSITNDGKVYLIKIYRHNQQDNLSPIELKSLRNNAKEL